MRRLAVVLWLIASAAHADWTVAERLPLSPDGTPIDLASIAREGETDVRIVLSGTFTFLMDGAEVDAFGSRTGETRDESVRFVILPAGARVIEADTAAHRYTIEVPRAARMPVAFNAMPLAMRNLVTLSEARSSLQGAIVLEHMVPPPPPPTALAVVADQSSHVPIGAWLAAALAIAGGLAIAGWVMRRRRDPGVVLMRRGRRARAAIARESAALGPAFDPVAASAARLLEAMQSTIGHWRALTSAFERTAFASAAGADREELAAKARRTLDGARELTARLERIATQLAGRNAETWRARGVDALIEELGADLDAAVSAEEELAHVA